MLSLLFVAIVAGARFLLSLRRRIVFLLSLRGRIFCCRCGPWRVFVCYRCGPRRAFVCCRCASHRISCCRCRVLVEIFVSAVDFCCLASLFRGGWGGALCISIAKPLFSLYFIGRPWKTSIIFAAHFQWKTHKFPYIDRITSIFECFHESGGRSQQNDRRMGFSYTLKQAGTA